MIEYWRVEIRGIVQGVGFRPFVARLARNMKLRGFVLNQSGQVTVEIEGEQSVLQQFLERIQTESPKASYIESLSYSCVEQGIEHQHKQGQNRFEIAPSIAEGRHQFVTAMDLAPCKDCLRELSDPANRRFQYPFINCDQCGPRFTIISDSPYDRKNTAMQVFEMCTNCQQEYSEESERRFHAQAVCCPECGPQLVYCSGDEHAHLSDDALQKAAELLSGGGILALKGVGGYQLLVDAENPQAVERLRQRKHRAGKPFAVMFLNLATVHRYARVNRLEADALASPAAPIVLLEASGKSLAPEVAPRSPWLGAVLPASPLHYLLAQKLCSPLVLTSGNMHGEPILTDDAEAFEKLTTIADGFLFHNREILHFADDSVVRIVNGKLQILRLARGYAPKVLTGVEVLGGLENSQPEPAEQNKQPAILATGGHLKQSPVLLNEGEVLCWPQVGDLDTLASRQAMARSLETLPRSVNVKADYLAVDRHPDYATSLWAERDGRPLIHVQHHHAHVAACLAEHNLTAALGIAWDGTGLGDDGSLWGCEFLDVCETGYQRRAWLRPFPLPGGDMAARDGWRVLAGLCAEANFFPEGGVLPAEDEAKLQSLIKLARNSSLYPMTSSMGRCFDAVAALAGLCTHSRFEAEAAMSVEFAAMSAGYSLSSNDIEPYHFEFDGRQLDWRPMLPEMFAEREQAPRLALRFHATLLAMVMTVVEYLRPETVALCGGCFQNRLLLENCEKTLTQKGYRVIFPQRVPPGDGGLALGQAWVAAQVLRNSAKYTVDNKNHKTERQYVSGNSR